MTDLWKKAQKSIGHLINDFMPSVATSLLQFQQFIYAQPTYVWSEILQSSAFRKLIVVTFKLRPNWHCLYCALITRASNGVNLGILFSMPPRVWVATRRSVRGPSAQLWLSTPSEEQPYPRSYRSCLSSGHVMSRLVLSKWIEFRINTQCWVIYTDGRWVPESV